MIEHGFTRTSVITRLRRGPLGAHLDTLAATLHQHGYAPDSIRRTLRAGDQFGRWLAQHGYAIAEVDEALVARYIRTLPPPRVGRWPKAAAGLPHLGPAGASEQKYTVLNNSLSDNHLPGGR